MQDAKDPEVIINENKEVKDDNIRVQKVKANQESA